MGYVVSLVLWDRVRHKNELDVVHLGVFMDWASPSPAQTFYLGSFNRWAGPGFSGRELKPSSNIKKLLNSVEKGTRSHSTVNVPVCVLQPLELPLKIKQKSPILFL